MVVPKGTLHTIKNTIWKIYMLTTTFVTIYLQLEMELSPDMCIWISLLPDKVVKAAAVMYNFSLNSFLVEEFLNLSKLTTI